MERLYHFFDMEDVVFDDERTVKELMERVFEESGYYEPNCKADEAVRA